VYATARDSSALPGEGKKLGCKVVDPGLALYPTARKVEDVLERESARGCVLGHRVTTFPQLTEALWGEVDSALVAVGPVGERLALDEAIARVQSAGDAGRPIDFAAGPGVRNHLLGLIRQFKSGALTGGDLLRGGAGLSPAAAARVSHIAEIFCHYDEVLRDAGAVDSHDRERLAVELVLQLEKAGRRPRLLVGVQRLLMAEVYDLSILQFMLVSSLIRMIGDAEVVIQAQPHKLVLTRFADLTWNRFVAEESIGDRILPHFVRRSGRKGQLGFVLTHLFTDAPPESPPHDRTVRILEAATIMREAEEVAREVRRILERPAAEQIALERIAIVTRDLEPYREHLEVAFRRYRVPLKVARSKPLSAYPPVRVVRDILRIPARNYRREDLMSLCRAPFVQLAAAHYVAALSQVGYIDGATRSLLECLESRHSELAGSLNGKASPIEIERLHQQVAYIERAGEAWRELLGMLETLNAPATICDHVQRIRAVLRRLGFDPLRDSLTDSAATSAGALELAFGALAREAAIVAPLRQVTLSEFAAIAERVFDEIAVDDAGAPLGGGVLAVPIAEARGLDFDLVFVIGLNDGVFPAYHTDDPLLPDDVIRSLNRPLHDALCTRVGAFAPDAPGPILRTRYERNAEEPFLFFLAMSMAQRTIVLSYAAMDASGSSLPASPFVTEVRRILPDLVVERISAGDCIVPAVDCFALDEFVKRAAADSILSRVSFADLADVAEIGSILRRTEVERQRQRYFRLPSREELVAERRRDMKGGTPALGTGAAQWLSVDLSADSEKFASATAYDGRVGPSSALRQFLLAAPDGGPRPWSAAQLGELAGCGFRFFARRVLLLRGVDELSHEQSRLESGSLVHEVLRAIFEKAGQFDLTRLRELKQQVLAAFHRQRRLAARDPAFFELDWQSVVAMIEESVEYEIARRAAEEVPAEVYYELPLDFVIAEEPRDVRSHPLAAALLGWIDRLEIYREGARIRRLKLIDYKTSRRLHDYATLLEPERFACEDLQMPLYALGAVTRDRKSTRLNSSHPSRSRMPSSA